MLLLNICRVYMPHRILLKGIYFDLSFCKQRWNVYAAGNLFKIKRQEKRNIPITKIKHIILKSTFEKPCSFLYRSEHATLVCILMLTTVLRRIFRGFPF